MNRYACAWVVRSFLAIAVLVTFGFRPLQAQVDTSTWDAAEQTIRQLIPLSKEVASTRTVVLLRDIPGQLARNARVPGAFQEQVAMLSAALDESPV